jgi:hypothetical protein
VVVETPAGSGEDATGGNFEQDGVDVAVLVGWRVVRQALEEAFGVEGDQEVFVVHVMEGQHGAACKQELRRDGEKPDVL